MHEQIADLLITLYENQKSIEKIYKNNADAVLNDFSITEMHCIDFIGRTENPNVTRIALLINMTRGAVSKIIKKLIAKNAIEPYMNSSNKKEIYYRLTSVGAAVFDAHKKIHKNWHCKDLEFFNNYSKTDLRLISDFIKEYNKYLGTRLQVLNGDA